MVLILFRVLNKYHLHRELNLIIFIEFSFSLFDVLGPP